MGEVKKLKGTIYKCENCGSFLRYDPISKKLKCTHCLSTENLEPVGKAQELTYNDASENHYEPWGETKSVKCRSCGAETVLNEFETTSNCPFCGASNVASLSDIPGIRPNAILPFAVSEEEAQQTYVHWVTHQVMAPLALKKKAEKQTVQGVYVPMFTFDTSTFSRYTIRYGRHYTVTVGAGKNKRTEVRTRWYTDSGTIAEDFDDIQVEASQYITTKDVKNMDCFDTENSVNYHSQFISGYCSERYSSSLDDCWEAAKATASKDIRSNILRRYSYDVLDYCNVSTTFSNNTFKYCLVPVWIVGYTYKGKDYRCIINGRNGKATGTSPVSPIKVGALVLTGLAIVGALGYLFFKYFMGM